MSTGKHPFLSGLLFLIVFIGIFGLGIYLILFKFQVKSNYNVVQGSSPYAIGIINLTGAINSSSNFISLLNHYKHDSFVKAVVIRVNSPGGEVAPSQAIYEQLTKFKKYKKVVVSMGSVAASGAYYVSSAANEIVAEPGTLTGSIGVIMEMPNVYKLMKKVGVSYNYIVSGPYKDIGTPFKEMTPKQREKLQGVVMDVYGQFVDAVAKGRSLKVAYVKKLANGMVYSGQQALKYHLVDKLGDFEDAIDAAKVLAGIKGKPTVIYPVRKQPNLFQSVIKRAVKSFIDYVGGKTFLKGGGLIAYNSAGLNF
ncbi:MAG: signal peptide peptidase SppA [Candidatus Acidulodesulfobacterium ferriphilum]|uniref:Signal peptide peptidase SppA n=1 Tax=Candidatus Acidulodesulfobacterium ferriphilum TaxID=2597223 RepID=A0A519B9Y9_9DELT|nr:MAG: signal peptide peptidase SppA [Candidatus Acidulodesulfobacterium ferriphilum]